MTDEQDGPIIIVTPTIMDGTTVRWYRTLRAAENYSPVLSASRKGVMVHSEYLTSIPDAWIAAARQAHQALREDDNADLHHLATHRHRGPSNGPLEPVGRVSSDG